MTEDKTYSQVHKDIEWLIDIARGSVITHSQIDTQFNYKSREAKRYRWQVLDAYVKGGLLESRGAGKYLILDDDIEETHWQEADVENTVNVMYPLGLEKWVKTYHKSIIVLAGVPGSGKTAFLEHFVLKNMNNPMGVTLFNNDMSPEEIKERMDNAGIFIPSPAPFKIYDRDAAFGDVIRPDGINVIDYLDLNSEVYMIGQEIEYIYRKLKRGIALIGIQKRAGQDVGIGGMFSLKRPKLYLSLDYIREGTELFHKLKIVKSRGRTDPSVNPNGMEFKFKLIGGIKFWLKEAG